MRVRRRKQERAEEAEEAEERERQPMTTTEADKAIMDGRNAILKAAETNPDEAIDQSLFLLDELSNVHLDSPNWGLLNNAIERAKEAVCTIKGHVWEIDQCGYWQHQYCFRCGCSKYPLLISHSCSKLSAEMGGMTEAEYVATLTHCGTTTTIEQQ